MQILLKGKILILFLAHKLRTTLFHKLAGINYTKASTKHFKDSRTWPQTNGGEGGIQIQGHEIITVRGVVVGFLSSSSIKNLALSMKQNSSLHWTEKYFYWGNNTGQDPSSC